jgi:hypothetical protein
MTAKLIEVVDASVLEYSVGFPVLEIDLAIFLNGNRLVKNTDYTFNGNSNTIIVNAIEVGDMIQARKMRNKP